MKTQKDSSSRDLLIAELDKLEAQQLKNIEAFDKAVDAAAKDLASAEREVKKTRDEIDKVEEEFNDEHRTQLSDATAARAAANGPLLRRIQFLKSELRRELGAVEGCGRIGLEPKNVFRASGQVFMLPNGQKVQERVNATGGIWYKAIH